MLRILCIVLLLAVSCTFLVECRSYNNGLIFYNLENHNTYLPPTISVSRGRGLAKFPYSPRGSIWSTFGKPCDCEGPLCGCCVGIKVKQYNFDQKMCANVSYVRPKDEIQMEVFLNDTATAKYGIAARNPSPLCVPIMMGIPMSMCVQMSNIAVQGDNLNMCMDFLVRLASTQLFEMHFQCMKVGLQGASWVGPNGQPVIPPSESKIKDLGSNESEEYYDESEAEEENEIISKEKESEVMQMQEAEEDLNKAEEEMDDNDVRDKIMDIVKEEEEMQDSAELMKENEIEGLSPVQDHTKVEEIVTNIMESINEGNGSEESDKYITMPIVVENVQESEVANKESMQEANVMGDANPTTLEAEENNMQSIMETNALVEEDFQIKTPELSVNEETKKDELIVEPELLEESETLKLEINDLKDVTENHMEMEESNEITKLEEYLEDLENKPMKDELHLEDLFDNFKEKDGQVESNVEEPQKENNENMEDVTDNQDKPNENKESNMEMMADTTEHISNDYESGKIEKFEMLINNEGAEEITEITQIDNELNNSLEKLQQPTETSTERLMAANLKPTMPQIAATTSETDSIDNTLTTATIMTTTTTTKTTKKPILSDEIPAVAVTFIENVADKTNNNDEEEDKNNNDDKDNDGDNSHENDSDYEDEEDEEESDESEDETTEKGIQTNNVITTIVMPTTAASNHKESSRPQKLPNASNSNESNSNDETNENTKDEFEAVEELEEGEENADDEEVEESNEHKENDAAEEEEEEYEDEYEDYETTTVAVSDSKTDSSANDTCCKFATSAGGNDMQATSAINEDRNNTDTNTAAMPQLTNIATSNNLQFVSNVNTMISSNSDSNMLNVESTTNKMSQITIAPAAATIAVPSSTTSSNSNAAMPLPLARKLYAHHQQQLHNQHHYHHQQQYHRHSRQQRQHYV